jgi:hypothetical protein
MNEPKTVRDRGRTVLSATDLYADEYIAPLELARKVPQPTRAQKLEVLDRLDRRSSVVRPLRRAAPLLTALLAASGLALAVVFVRRAA